MMRWVSILLFLFSLTACETNQKVKTTGSLEEIESWRTLADKAYRDQQYDVALTHYENISSVVPHDAEIWFRIGNTRNRLGQHEDALSAYSEAIIRNSAYSKAWHNRSMLQLKIAAEGFQEALQHIKPSDPVYKSSIRASQKLLEVIEQSNAIISTEYDVTKSKAYSPADVEVIIMKESRSAESTEDKQPNEANE